MHNYFSNIRFYLFLFFFFFVFVFCKLHTFWYTNKHTYICRCIYVQSVICTLHIKASAWEVFHQYLYSYCCCCFLFLWIRILIHVLCFSFSLSLSLTLSFLLHYLSCVNNFLIYGHFLNYYVRIKPNTTKNKTKKKRKIKLFIKNLFVYVCV